MPLTKQYVEDHFESAAAGDYDTFFSKVSPNVKWTVMGHHALSGTYNSVDDFKKATFARLTPRMKGNKLELTQTNCLVDGQQALVELTADATQQNGAPFLNKYAWVLRYDDQGIVQEVRAFLDGELVNETINGNEGP